jgi:glycosyltransferase involved in cell wall biosynthesis
MTKIPKILFIQRDDGGCGFFRIKQPADFIKRMGLAETKIFFKDKPSPEELLSADLVVMQEMGTVEAANIGQFMVQNKIPFICEVDDFLHHVSPHNTAGYGAWNPGTLFIYRATELMRKAQGMTVSTNQLAREYFPYNDTIYVVPNYLDQQQWEHPIVRKSDGKVRIGWMGGNAHADDLKMISGVLERVVKESKGKVLFETFGMTRHELTEPGTGSVFKTLRPFNNTCPHCNFEGDLKHYPGEPLDQYSMVLASKGWDIAVAPVINNSFGNCKSDLKIKEYSAAGYPIIASPIQPYREAAENGARIVFAETFDQWYNSIKKMVKISEIRDEMTKANREWIKQYWIQENAQKIFEVYRQIIHRYPRPTNVL